MGKTERRLPRERERSGREPLRRRGHASTGLSIARGARCAALVRTVVSALSARSVVVHQSASTVFSAMNAGSAVVDHSASTVVSAVNAKSAVGHRYASTVVGAPPARSAVVDQSASTVVSAIHAKSAVGDQSASTVVCAISARSARSSKRRLTHHRSRYDEQLTVRVVVSNCTPITEIERVSSNNQTNEPRYRACQSNFDEFQSRLPAEERYLCSCTHPPFTHARSD